MVVDCGHHHGQDAYDAYAYGPYGLCDACDVYALCAPYGACYGEAYRLRNDAYVRCKDDVQTLRLSVPYIH